MDGGVGPLSKHTVNLNSWVVIKLGFKKTIYFRISPVSDKLCRLVAGQDVRLAPEEGQIWAFWGYIEVMFGSPVTMLSKKSPGFV